MTQIVPYAPTPAPAKPGYIDGLPNWLNYLIASFPAARLSENTFAVMEDAFRDEDPAVMRAAARLAVNEQRFFPSVYELRGYVRRESERLEVDQYRIPDYIYYRRASAGWPTCPVCGERINPAWDVCPACQDLARMEES